MMIYAFVDAQKTDFPVATLCRVWAVSTSGYYAWAERVAAGRGIASGGRYRGMPQEHRWWGSPQEKGSMSTSSGSSEPTTG